LSLARIPIFRVDRAEDATLAVRHGYLAKVAAKA
jgi:hypothetical protein